MIIGPITQLVTMEGVSLKGPVSDDALVVHENVFVEIENGRVAKISSNPKTKPTIELSEPTVALPGFIDAHTHLCFAGSRARDYARRLEGWHYLEIAAEGGGILDTVRKTREATKEELVEGMEHRLKALLERGVTTCEVKSGYGLTVEDEIKMLEAIHDAQRVTPIAIIPTCLAAHITPPEFDSSKVYLEHLKTELFPLLKKYTNRIDIFVEEGAFSVAEAREYLLAAKSAGFKLTLHANQFSSGGAQLAAEVGALSADHLEHLSNEECDYLSQANVVAVVLPGASLGLGMQMAPARKMLDSGLSVAIASDWNPGSAPMGDLLTQAALIGASEKLSMAETLSAITLRAANALGLDDRGVIEKGKRADLAFFPTDDYREILYHQGALKPSRVCVKGEIVYE